MARPRTPKAKAKVTGADKKNKGIYEPRTEVTVDEALGDPPDWIVDTDKNKAREAWNTLRVEIPWLNASHRILVATAANIFGRMIAQQDVGVQALNLLRQCLGQMGATPADASKVGATKKSDDEADPAAKYFT
jgi:phosphoribosylformylglycinamidine (FGAM) synthase-like enzyme